MKRRRFMQALAAAPAAPLIAQQATPQTAPPPPPPTAQPAVVPPGPGRGPLGGTAATPALQTVSADTVAQPAAPSFFNAQQFAALRKLGGMLQPPLKGNPGALECGAPEFLDFLIGASPADTQHLYKNGLDALNTQARKQFSKPFADLDGTQADAIVKPLMAPIPWNEDLPTDPVKHFIAQAHRDFRTATVNSREYSTASASGGRRGFGGGRGLYWLPIDPVKG